MVKRRGTACSICAHPKRHLIEIALTYKTPMRVLAQRFGASHHALFRHSKHHLSAAMRAAILTAARPIAVDLEALKVSEAEGLLGALLAQRARLQQHAETALEVGSLHVAVAAEARITENLRLVSQLLGQLVQHHQVTHASVLVSPDYLRLRQTLIETLKPFPAAALAVSKALQQLESEAAQDIEQRANDGKRSLLIEHDAGALQ